MKSDQSWKIQHLIQYIISNNLSQKEERKLWVDLATQFNEDYIAANNLIETAISWDSTHKCGYFGSHQIRESNPFELEKK